ncbi:MAG: chromosome segregation protein SMC [Promethearchaeota archaeon]|nr:MAG: chromosome segregation protein SMC [Candidatus Lokiarchaeota archaeon]
MSSKGQIKENLIDGVYIRKVILENFLSFQRDEVDFEKGKFCLIIGPNWSGKTSIYQAIKFGLGSNERDERYSRWSDFIRHGQNHAMAEIHIQNQDELIQIRRTVIRGQSPYFSIKGSDDADFKRINVQELQELIKDLNYNPDNHFAFVSQGKIDLIKNLKPTELCTFLEEGIGLKGLREEILQQKKNVLSMNKELQSISNKRNVLNISLELLQPKLERLEQKKKLVEIKNGYEDELLWANRYKLQDEIKTLKRNILKIQVAIDEIKKSKANIEKSIKIVEEQILKIDENVNNLSVKIGEKTFRKKQLIDRIQSWQNEKVRKKQELDVLSDKISKLEKVLNNYKSQKTSIDNEIKIINQEKTNIETKIDNLIKEQNALTQKIKRNEEFLAKYNQLISDKKEKKTLIQQNNDEIKSLNNEISQIFQSFKDIEHKLEKHKWFLENPTKNLLSKLDQELKVARNELFTLDTNIQDLEREKYKKINRLKPLQVSLRERRIILPSQITILKEEIRKRELNVKGPIIEYLKYDDRLSYAIESVLGEKLLYSFIADNWDTLELLKRLKNKYKAYCNIYVPKEQKISPLPSITGSGVIGYLAELIKVIDNDIDIKKVLYSKIKNCLVVKDYRSGKETYQKYNFKGKCVTLKGEQIISYKYVYETPFLKNLKGLLSAGTQEEQASKLESEISALNERILELRVQASKLDEKQRDLFGKKETFNDLLYSFNQRQRLTTKKNNLYDQRSKLADLNNSIQEEIKTLNTSIKKLESQKDPEFFKWNKRIKKIPEELNNLNDEKKKWDTSLIEKQEILNEVASRLKTHRDSLNEIKKDFKTKQDNFQKADNEAFEVYRELEVIDDELNSIDEQTVNLKEEKSKVLEEKRALDKTNLQISLNLEQENTQLNYSKQELESKEEDLERINTKIGPLISKEEIKIRPIEEIKNDILLIDKKLMKYLDVDDSILVEKDQILEGLKEISLNQKELEKDIKAALNTEKKMETTYNDKFKVVLNDLKTKINRKFKSSQINEYCSLELIGDFEELGVDIKASTTRKQLVSCSALSGGQVSMISICLMLSLQEIKPSPLCMFDEAAMFLDDKNSEAVYQMIKATLEENPAIQLFLFLPTSSKSLYLLADKIIGVARVGKNEVSTIFKPKIIKKKH